MESTENTTIPKKKKKKGLIITLSIIAAVLILGTVSFFVIRHNIKKAIEQYVSENEPVYVQKMDLTSTLSSTGSIISSNEASADPSGDVSSYPVKEIKVRVGDTVNAGDVLYTLDMSSLETELATAREQLAITQQQNDAAISSANRTAQETHASGELQLETAAQQVAQAKEDLDSNPSSQKYLQAYQDALNNQTSVINSVNAANAASQDNINNAQLSAQSSVLTEQANIAKMEAILNQANVTAPISGTVTAVNVTAGSAFAGTGGIVIDNLSQFEASASIDEASINKIKTGMKVIIKTDATGEEELTGTVVFVSPTPTKSSTDSLTASSATSSVSTSRATYRVDVALDKGNTDLRLGMTAKMSFILDSAEDVFAVPSDYISTADDGSKYITIQNNDGSSKTISVTCGMENDYYTEISGEGLSAGQLLVSPSDSATSADAVVSDSGALGGITD